jgi:hypothetical protein
MFSFLSKIYLQIEKYSLTIITLLFGITCWLFGFGNIDLLRLWYCIIMPILFILRIPDFIKKKYHHFFYEFCYFINILAIIILLFNYNINIIYPFLHGPLLLYSLVLKDKFNLTNLSETTSFALHSFGTIITYKIYWNNLETTILTLDTYFAYIKKCSFIYLSWFVIYSIYLFYYSGYSLTSLKYFAKLKENEKPNVINKLSYLVVHLILIFISTSFGIVLMHNYKLDKLFCFLQLIISLINGNINYNKKMTEAIKYDSKYYVNSHNE